MRTSAADHATYARAFGAPHASARMGSKKKGRKGLRMRHSIEAFRFGDRITWLHATKGWRSKRLPAAAQA